MLLKKKKRNHQPKNRALPSSSTKQSAQQRVREQRTKGTTSPLKPLLSSTDGARSCRLLFAVSAAVRTWCGGGMSASNAMLPCFANGVTYGCRDCQRFELVPNITTTKMYKALSSHQIDAAFARIRKQQTRGRTSPTGLAWRRQE